MRTITLSPKAKKIAKAIAYPLFYSFCLLLFSLWLFPFERLKERIEAEFNARQPAGAGTRLSIEEMSGYWLSGVEAENIKLTSPAPTSKPGAIPAAKPPKPSVLKIEEAHARVSLLNLLVGTLQVGFGAEALGGEISGTTSDADKSRELDVSLEELNVGQLPALTHAVGLPMTGSLSGSIKLKLPEAKISKADGEIDLRIEDLSIGDGKAKIRNTIALPKLRVGTLEFVADVSAGKLKVKTFSAKGKDIEVVGDGGVQLRDPMDRSLAQLNMRFKFADGYKNKNDMTRGLFGAPGSTIPGLFDLDAKNRRAKRADGFYAWRLTGPLGTMRTDPAGSVSTTRPRGRSRGGFGP